MIYRRGDSHLRRYEARVLMNFRNSLTNMDREKYDKQWALMDEVSRSPDGKIVTFYGIDTKSGVTEKTHPLSIRIFGTVGSGSCIAATLSLDCNNNASNITVEVVFYDGIGPVLYFDKSPYACYDIDNKYMEVNMPFLSKE